MDRMAPGTSYIKAGEKKTKKCQRQANNLKKNDKFIISKFCSKSVSDEKNDELMLHVPLNIEPSTSVGSKARLFKRHPCSSDDENGLEKMESIQEIAKTQILIMIDSLQDESFYIECLEKLIEIENKRKSGEDILGSKNNCYENKMSYSRSCQKLKTGDTKHSKIVSIEAIKYQHSLNGLEERNDEDPDCTNPKLKGQTSERIIMRKELLSKLESCYDNYEPYNILFERLLDMEESFII